ncbi:MAG: hypothetical protein WCJ64_01900 [Rhodospirillaceae bacterium]
MSRHLPAGIVAGALLCASLAACQTAPQEKPDLLSTKSAVELRAMQTRAFDTTDRNKTLRTVVATLQDVGYTLDKIEPAAGTVSATKLDVLRLTALVYPRGAKQMAVSDAAPYQQFFAALGKAMFLTANEVD